MHMQMQNCVSTVLRGVKQMLRCTHSQCAHYATASGLMMAVVVGILRTLSRYYFLIYSEPLALRVYASICV